jgi:tricorn protease
MWHGEKLYYLSDDGPSHRLNLWVLDPGTLARTQLTTYADYDVKWPAIGPGPAGGGEIVFQHGSDLVLFDVPTGATRAVEVTIPGAQAKLRTRSFDASDTIDSWDLGPTGKRVLVSARGDAWSLPAKNGSPRNLTRTSGVAERDATWSRLGPEGSTIAALHNLRIDLRDKP